VDLFACAIVCNVSDGIREGCSSRALRRIAEEQTTTGSGWRTLKSRIKRRRAAVDMVLGEAKSNGISVKGMIRVTDRSRDVRDVYMPLVFGDCYPSAAGIDKWMSKAVAALHHVPSSGLERRKLQSPPPSFTLK